MLLKKGTKYMLDDLLIEVKEGKLKEEKEVICFEQINNKIILQFVWEYAKINKSKLVWR